MAGYVAGWLGARTVDRRLAAAVAAADRDDPAWRFDDLLANREPVPDEENSSIVMDKVLSLLPSGWLSTKALAGKQRTPTGRFMEDFGQLQATAENIRLPDSVARSLRAELDSHKEAVTLARTLAGFRRGRHEYEIGPTITDTPLRQTEDARPSRAF